MVLESGQRVIGCFAVMHFISVCVCVCVWANLTICARGCWSRKSRQQRLTDRRRWAIKTFKTLFPVEINVFERWILPRAPSHPTEKRSVTFTTLPWVSWIKLSKVLRDIYRTCTFILSHVKIIKYKPEFLTRVSKRSLIILTNTCWRFAKLVSLLT